MARVLGYGGVANTNGARDFSGKEAAATGTPARTRFDGIQRRRHPLWSIVLAWSVATINHIIG